jgi:hypothetical protein
LNVSLGDRGPHKEKETDEMFVPAMDQRGYRFIVHVIEAIADYRETLAREIFHREAKSSLAANHDFPRSDEETSARWLATSERTWLDKTSKVSQ